jgi:transcription initiation factor TFIIIB Brf1 subunit/transcription initiation factor TFIIB
MAETIAKNFIKHGVEEGKKPETIAGVSIFMAMTNFGAQSKDAENVWL